MIDSILGGRPGRSPRRWLHSAGHAVHMLLRAWRNRLPPNHRCVEGRQNSIITAGAVLRNVRIDVCGDENVVEIQPNARIHDTVIRLQGHRHRLTIESHVTVWSGRFQLEDEGGTLMLGERTTIWNVDVGVTEGGHIRVGPDCLFASGIQLRNGDSHVILDEQTGRRLNPACDISIAEHVWLGERVLALKGSAIGPHCVVGAGSIVTGELPGHSVCAGCPARPLRTGVTWRRER